MCGCEMCVPFVVYSIFQLRYFVGRPSLLMVYLVESVLYSSDSKWGLVEHTKKSSIVAAIMV